MRLEYHRDRRGIINGIDEKRHDNAGALTSITHWSYSYDSATRLRGAAQRQGDGASTTTTTYAYTYDPAGNRLTKTKNGVTTNYHYNSLGQLTSDGTTSYEYDAYGNLEYEKQGTQIQRQYYWSVENRLLRVDLYESGEVSRTVAFGYDDHGNRVSRQDGGGALTRYLTDEQNPTGYSQVIAETDASGSGTQRDYVYGSELLKQTDAGAGAAWFASDHLGSIRGLTDSAGAELNNTSYDYSPYGVPQGVGADYLPGAASSLTNYAFTGQWREESLRVRYYRGRIYNTASASWLNG